MCWGESLVVALVKLICAILRRDELQGLAIANRRLMMMEAEFDYSVTYIPFPGGGTVAKNLVGKQIDSTVNNPSEQMAFYKAGNTKPLIQFTGERMAAFPDVPTAKELGINIEYYMQRSVNGPPGMSDGAVKFYTNLFQELFDSKEWQDFCTSDGLTCDSMIKNADLGKFHADQYELKALSPSASSKAVWMAMVTPVKSYRKS